MDDRTRIERRDLLALLGATPLAGLLASPALRAEVAAGLETVEITTSDGRRVRGALALPATLPAPAIVTIHEWWGLNDQIKTVTADFAREGYVTLAVDLYDGKVATTPDEAGALARATDPEQATATLEAWVSWLRAHEATTGKLGTVGWCFGGGWSLNAAIAAPVDGCVIYYGRCDRPASDMARLKGPVLGHFATRDGFINREMVGRFEAAMKAAGKPYEVHWYEADHAFANPTSARYDAEDAALAHDRTRAFFARTLTG